MKIEIRRARRADLDAICALEERSFGADAFSRRQFGYLLERARGACFVALRDGEILGYMSLLDRPWLGNLRLYSIAVAPTARGLGIGQRLLDAAIAYARERGFQDISLEVSVANTVAQTLYRKNGFEIAGRLTAYYHDGSDGLRMKRTL